jgi:hypothetical protein
LLVTPNGATVEQDDEEPPMPLSAQARFDDTLARIDTVLDRSMRRVEAVEARADAARADAARARARADANDCREHMARYDTAFSSFGTETPQARDGEDPESYRCRLFRRLQKRLPDHHELVGVGDPADLPDKALEIFEEQLLREAAAEGASPSEANLPPSGEMISRTRVDSDTNEKSINWYGTRSFIHDLGRPGRLVERIVDRSNGSVIWGRDFAR